MHGSVAQHATTLPIGLRDESHAHVSGSRKEVDSDRHCSLHHYAPPGGKFPLWAIFMPPALSPPHRPSATLPDGTPLAARLGLPSEVP